MPVSKGTGELQGKNDIVRHRPAPEASYVYPPSAYRVLCWWNAGHWITALSRRIPVSNGFQRGAKLVAAFYLATDQAEALEIANAGGARYVLVEAPMLASLSATPGMMTQIAPWAERSLDEYYQRLYRVVGNQLEPQLIFRPPYYRSMISRLFLDEAEAQSASGSVWAVTFNPSTLDGQFYRRIVDEQEFDTYEQAAAYAAQKGDKNTLVGGYQRDRPCIDLEPLDRFTLVYRSSLRAIGSPEAVKVFEIVPQP